jgi:THO complex subunit 7
MTHHSLREIAALENDMAAIHSENEIQEKIKQGHKSALDGIVAELASLRFLGRDKDAVSEAPSPRASPVPDASGGQLTEAHTDVSTPVNSVMPTPSAREDMEDSAESDSQKVVDTNPDDDIEMGELEEDPKEKEAAVKKKPIKEELEEGETFDGSSELSEPPDDSEDEL